MKTALKHIQQFKKHNPDFNWEHFSAWNKEAFNAQIGKELHEKTKKHTEEGTKHLQAYQRLFRLTQDHPKSEALFGAGYHSAIQIADLSKHEFVKEAAPLFKSNGISAEAQAEAIHKAAVSKKSHAVLTFTNIMQQNEKHYKNARFANMTAEGSGLENLPSYADLFGNVDFCSCESCRSIFSPAAYFVDLMRMQAKYITSPDGNDTTFDLKTRRPDLWEIPLSCENTNTEISKLEIVNEVLEKNKGNNQLTIGYDKETIDFPLISNFDPTNKLEKNAVIIQKPKNYEFVSGKGLHVKEGAFILDFTNNAGIDLLKLSCQGNKEEVEQKTAFLEVYCSEGSSIELYGMKDISLDRLIIIIKVTDVNGKTYNYVSSEINFTIGIRIVNSHPIIEYNGVLIEKYNDGTTDFSKITLGKLIEKVKLEKKPISKRIATGSYYFKALEAYNYKSISVYPWNQPFNHSLNKIRESLAVNKTDLAKTWKALSPNNFETFSYYCEILGLSFEQWILYSTPITNEDDLAKLYGLISGDELSRLDAVDTFLHQTNLSRDEVDNLLVLDLSDQEIDSPDKPQKNFFINRGQVTPLVIENGEFGVNSAKSFTKGISTDALDRINRFVRLAHAVHWTFAELDWVLETIAHILNDSKKDAIESGLPYLAWVQKVKNQHGISIYEACAALGSLRDIGDKNGPTFYASVFENPNIPNLAVLQNSPEWRVQGSNVSDINGSDKDILNALATALKMNQSDVLKVANAFLDRKGTASNTTRSITLDKGHLALFYRWSLVPKITGWTIDYLTNSGLSAEFKKAFNSVLHTLAIDAIKGVEQLADDREKLVNTHFTPYRLQYVLTGKNTAPDLQNGVLGADTIANFNQSLNTAIIPVLYTKARFKEGVHGLLTTADLKKKAEHVFGNLQSSHCVDASGVVLSIPAVDTVKVWWNLSQTDDALAEQLSDLTVASLSHDQLNQQHTFYQHLSGLYGISQNYFPTLIQHVPIILANVIDVRLNLTDAEKDTLGLNASQLHLMQRYVYLVRQLGLSVSEVESISTHPQYYGLKTGEQETNEAEELFTWSEIKTFVTFKQLIVAFGDSQNHLINYFEFVDSNVATPSPSRSQAAEKLSGITHWNATQIESLINLLWPIPTSNKTRNANLKPQPAYGTVAGVALLKKYFDLSKSLNIDIATVVLLNDLSGDTNTGFTAVADALWSGVVHAKSKEELAAVSNHVNGLKRDALVPIVMCQLNKKHGLKLQTPRDLYEYLLIDVEVEGVVKTSRIKAGISAVQLYIYRSLNNLNLGVPTIAEQLTDWWPWVQHYRNWQANREVFLYPENYLEPQLRKNKSPIFTQLESDLQQADLANEDSITSAFNKYMDSFVDIADLTIVGAGKKNMDDLHVELFLVGQTKAAPHAYYYLIAEFSKNSTDDNYEPQWGYWKPITCHMKPTLINNKNFKDFITLNIKLTDSDESGNTNQLVIPQYENGKWYIYWEERRQVDTTQTSNGTSKKVEKDFAKYAYLTNTNHWSSAKDVSQILNIHLFNDLANITVFEDENGLKTVVGQFDQAIVVKREKELIPNQIIPDFGSEFTLNQVTKIDGLYYIVGLCKDQKIIYYTQVSDLYDDITNATFEKIDIDSPLPPYVQIFKNGDKISGLGRTEDQKLVELDVIPYPGIMYTVTNVEYYFNVDVYKDNQAYTIIDGTLNRIEPDGTPQDTLLSDLKGFAKLAFRNDKLYVVIGSKENSLTVKQYTHIKDKGFHFESELTIDAPDYVYDESQPNNFSFVDSTNCDKVCYQTGPLKFKIAEINFNSQTLASEDIASKWNILQRNGVAALIYPYSSNIGGFKQRTIPINATVVPSLETHLGQKGIEGLLATANQYLKDNWKSKLSIPDSYTKAPVDQMNFFDGPMANYYWEIFFHAPFLVANALQNELQFEAAKQWYQYIFNPSHITQDKYGILPISDSLIDLSEYIPIPLSGTKWTDDEWSKVVNLGFEFIFFNQPYEQVVISSNGVVSFDTSLAGKKNASRPKSDSLNLCKNAIMGIYSDMNPEKGGTIKYKADGQKFEVLYHEVPQYYGKQPVTARITLFKDSNNIEVEIETYQADIGHPAVIMIMNADGTLSYGPQDKDTDAWSARKKAWRFINTSEGRNDKYWRFIGLRSFNNPILKKELDKSVTQNYIDDLSNPTELSEYHNDPFDPHTIAHLRPIAYQKSVVMHYIDNLIQWGDNLFKQYSIEDINEAEMLYVMAYDLLGEAPRDIPGPDLPAIRSLSEILASNKRSLDNIHEFLVSIEQNQSITTTTLADTPANYIPGDYFGIPENENFKSYWTTVQERLHDIRNSLNIKGQVEHPALFQPAINPATLVASVASGNGTLASINAAQTSVPYYRFGIMLQKAKEVTSTVIQFGNVLLSALEKKDAASLTLIYNMNQQHIQALTKTAKQDALSQAQSNIKALQAGLESAQNRAKYYSGLIENGYSAAEIAQLTLEGHSLLLQSAGLGMHELAAIEYDLPTVFGLAEGGFNPGGSVVATGQVLQGMASIESSAAGLSGTVGGFQRRREEWVFQEATAKEDVNQVSNQLLAAQYQEQMAKQDLVILEKSIEQDQKVENFLKNKFSDEQLYDWMIGKLSALYFQAYQLANNLAVQAQNAWAFEKGIDFTESGSHQPFIHSNNWDNLHQGLLAGEALQLDLQRMESAYMKQDQRRLEITKTIVLSKLTDATDSKIALNELKESGHCSFKLEKPDFDKNYEDHYCRQIKSVSVSIPAVLGPYQNIHAILTQTSNTVNRKPDGQDAVSDYRSNQQIAISRGVNDNGLFEMNFNDPRYLPFEGTGAISTWELSIPLDKNPSLKGDDGKLKLSEVIIEIKYTALS